MAAEAFQYVLLPTERDGRRAGAKLRRFELGELLDEGIDFVGDPVIREQDSEESAGEEEEPAATAPDSCNARVEQRQIDQIGGGVAEIGNECEYQELEKIGEVESGTEMWPSEEEPREAGDDEDGVVEDAAGFPVAERVGEGRAEGNWGVRGGHKELHSCFAVV
jgi:hypothetical protein